MNNKLAMVVIAVLTGVVLGLVISLGIDYIEYQKMLAFERELDEAVRRVKLEYGGN